MQGWNRILYVAFALAVSGCVNDRLSSNNVFGTTNDRFSITKDRVVVASGAKDTTNWSSLRQGSNIEAYLAIYYQASENAAKFESKLPSALISDPGYAQALIRYRSAGFDASRAVCDYAINLLGEAHSNYKFASQSVNLLAAGGSTLLGIFQASARSIAVYAAGTTLYQAWSQDFEEYAYLTASIGTVGKKVEVAQKTYRDGVEGRSPAGDSPTSIAAAYLVTAPTSWSDASLQIQKYNGFCLATGMRALIEDAVGKSDVYFDHTKNDVTVIGAQSISEMQQILKARQINSLQDQITIQRDRIRIAQADQDRRAAGIAAANLFVSTHTSPYFDISSASIKQSLADMDLADAKSKLMAAQLVQNSATPDTRAQATANAQQAQARLNQVNADIALAGEIFAQQQLIPPAAPDWKKPYQDVIDDAGRQIANLQAQLDGLSGSGGQTVAQQSAGANALQK